MTRFADAAGTRIAYDIVGEGPDLVFLHAGIADRTMWEPQVGFFSGRFRCTVLDNRGFGESAIGNEPFSRRDDLAAVLAAIDADTATVIGCSIGAGFALDFAIERPERVEKLILSGVAPHGFEHPLDPAVVEIEAQVEAAIESGALTEAGRLEARLWVDGLSRPEGSAPEWLRQKVIEWSIPINSVTDWGDSKRLEPFAMHRLDEVWAPTLVIVGAEDEEFTRAASRATAEGIAGAQLVQLSGTAHLPNLEVPDAFNDALDRFLRDS
jgi:pimeloyl-ACP methyl ester carboxylesterase